MAAAGRVHSCCARHRDPTREQHSAPHGATSPPPSPLTRSPRRPLPVRRAWALRVPARTSPFFKKKPFLCLPTKFSLTTAGRRTFTGTRLGSKASPAEAAFAPSACSHVRTEARGVARSLGDLAHWFWSWDSWEKLLTYVESHDHEPCFPFPVPLFPLWRLSGVQPHSRPRSPLLAGQTLSGRRGARRGAPEPRGGAWSARPEG